MLYTIGDFGALTGLTARALRLYDARGLLPARRDPTNGHRYYRDDDLLPARRIALLRALGFSLPDIADLLAGLGDPEEHALVREAFRGELDRVRQAREDLSRREESLTATLRLLDAAPTGAEDLTRLAELRPASRRELMSTYRNASARFTTRGPRAHQEDQAWSQTTDTGGLFQVADGCGDDGIGAEASRLAVETVAEHLDPAALTPAGWARHLVGLFRKAHARVQPIGNGAATTLTSLVLHDGVAYVAHVGDTRAYRVSGEGLTRLTRDHSVVQDLVDAGELEPADAADHPQARYLSAALGMDGPLDEVFVHREEVAPGARYVLVSDGVSRVVPDVRIDAIVRGAATPEEAARALVTAADGDDNATVVVVDG